MIFSTSGKVIELVERGFRIRTESGEEVEVSTFADGWDLDLSVGDDVRVLGGPGRRADTFASSLIQKRGPVGGSTEAEWVEVKDDPSRQFRGPSLRARIRHAFRHFLQRR